MDLTSSSILLDIGRFDKKEESEIILTLLVWVTVKIWHQVVKRNRFSEKIMS